MVTLKLVHSHVMTVFTNIFATHRDSQTTLSATFFFNLWNRRATLIIESFPFPVSSLPF